MKVAVECESPLLQKSLEMFLANYLSSAKKSDLIVRDVKCIDNNKCFYISSDDDADLKKPFSKSQLILALEARYKQLNGLQEPQKEQDGSVSESLDFSILEKRIEYLTKEYQQNIITAVKAFYEK
jgi:hypothetical protein